MAFRFQKRVRVAPGLRLNISKRGVSTSFGKRGVSVTLGRRGLYGNLGLPGSGLSYRSRLDKPSANTWYENDTKNMPKTVSLKYNKKNHTLLFVDENDQLLAPEIEREIKREYADDIQLMYEHKEKKINLQTTKLLHLHKDILPERSPKELNELAANTVPFELTKPNKIEITEELRVEFEEGLNFYEKLRLLLPTRRKAFTEKVNHEAEIQFQLELKQFEQALAEHEEQKRQRLVQVEKVITGDLSAMGQWLEYFLSELDFPLETNVSYDILAAETVYLDVDLPQLEEIPLTTAEILRSGKLKIHKKSQRELRENYAMMVGGTALYLCSYVFSLLPTCKTIIISGYTQVTNKATGHLDDQYIYSLKVDKGVFYSLNFLEVHPITAFDNFEPIMNATKTYIFREITPYEPVK
ncbi:DUF4236 domain-containing protein [Anaerobacillus alkaliphilus]|uniref:DUF4236 domain-containing protein n=1 Tax=Anaerobacillus alkaliphilus TaxID=1548597 RepID=A0A4Q0VQW9_9BACI|nr:DUF4236 domain-containing protein [Anaerobacillus alkaliphilus]RXI99556.1 DUF4236 domain-containing protein [Anaerobacillus alkaliphilus]